MGQVEATDGKWKDAGDIPFILLADVVLLAKINKISYWLCGQQLEAVDDIDLRGQRSVNVSMFKVESLVAE